MVKRLAGQGFLIALMTVVAIGMTGWSPLVAAADLALLRNGIVAVVMFVMALPIEARSFGQALLKPAAPLAALSVNWIYQPLAAVLIATLFSQKTGEGLIVAAIIPCTLASAAVWTRRGNGNDAIALVVTVVTNGLCFLVAPLWLWILLGKGDDPARWLALMPQLALQVVLPMVLAQVLRLNSSIAIAATAKKRHLSLVAQVGILAMVGLGVAKVSQRLDGESLWALVNPLMLGGVVALHVSALCVAWLLSKWLRLPPADQIAVMISGSQKTIMVGLSLALDLGCSVLPLVAYHVMQLFVDTWVVDHWKAKQYKLNHETKDSASV